MSTMAEIPPAAALCVALRNPSHSVRPGSLTCTWVSMTAGITSASPKSCNSAPAGTESQAATASMRPPRTCTEAGPCPNTRRLRTTVVIQSSRTIFAAPKPSSVSAENTCQLYWLP